MNFYEFYTGKNFDAYKYLGAHMTENGVVFRTFAPAARKVCLIGEFNQWQEWEMQKIYDGNFWECYVEGARAGQMYKYRIYQSDGKFIDHCDPYGYGMELRPANASIIRDMSVYKFTDEQWMKTRNDGKEKPLNIYEIHFGSFKKKGEKAEDWYNYEELAELLIPYLKENGYNYVELMPLTEYPCDESWGYQSTGFFSPTSRYGTADELKAFVNLCHNHQIGVILDFVPVHFAVDGYALKNYDGTALYEYPHSAIGYSEWGSCNFMHSRGEVRSFLQSSVDYWLSQYHMDGIRMDAISRIIYWRGDSASGVNYNAVEFVKYMNQGMKKRYPGIILVAEDSTSFPHITKPVEEGGIGFDYKWDMGWMNDTLEYFKMAPEYRSENYHKLTFSMMYYYDDKFLLPLSHDEVVHGKATILQKMHGQYEEKFPQARAFYMYMMAHPGKKLNFMGNEIGQFREWDEKREQDWGLLLYPKHQEFHRFMKELNQFYLNHSAFYEKDFCREGFAWIDCSQEKRCIYAFERKGKKERIAAIFNFSNQVQKAYEFDVEGAKKLTLEMASDWKPYGGDKTAEKIVLKEELPEKSDAKSGRKVQEKERKGRFKVTLAPFSAYYFVIQ